jgi:uncharacterized protein YjdB
MTVGDTLQLTANLRNNRKRPRPTVWSSSAPNVASVSSSGLVTALTAGSAMVKASNQYATDSARIIVRSTSVVAASVAVKPDSVAVAVGDTTRLTSTVRDAADAIITGRAVSWSTSDTSIAVVSSAGLVTARRIGLANRDGVVRWSLDDRQGIGDGGNRADGRRSRLLPRPGR